MFSLVLSYLIISLLVTPIIRKATKQRIILESEINKVMTDSIRTIIDVHLSGSENYFQNKHINAGKLAFPFLWKAETLPDFLSPNRTIGHNTYIFNRLFPFFQIKTLLIF